MLEQSREWGMIVRVMRLYREEVKRLGLSRRAPRRAVRKTRRLLPLWLLVRRVTRRVVVVEPTVTESPG